LSQSAPRLQLHVGCGERRLPGYVHIDIRPLPGLDLVHPIDDLPMYADDSVDLIYNCHVLEHVGRRETQRPLREWWRILKPGGILRTAVPDLAACCAVYRETGDLTRIHGLLYGRQDYPENTHRIGFDWTYLKQQLEEAGFTDVRRYDAATTMPEGYDDYSLAYLNGTLVSLNVEATKPC
jgi:predicted SAM-dependent methyltransferase